MIRPRLARLLGFHINQILGWELGKVHPKFSAVFDWAQALGYELVLRPVNVREVGKIVVPWPDRKKMMAQR